MSDPWEVDSQRVVVVGMGAAGLAAALAARHAGARVLVIAAGEGASGVASGTWDLDTDPSVQLAADARSLSDLLTDLARARPAHPLAGPASRPALAALLGELERALPGLVAASLEGERALVATELGLFRRPALRQDALLDLGAFSRARIGVARLPSLHGLDPGLVAASLEELAVDAGRALRFAPVDVGLEGPADLVELARRLDAPAGRERLAQALRDALVETPCDAVLLPPILGVERSDVRAIVQAAVGRPVGEMSASVAGPQAMRPSAAIARALAAVGVTQRAASVCAVEVEPDGLLLTLADEPSPHAKSTTLRARVVVLATGKQPTASLLSAEGLWREPLAGLPMYERGQPLGPRALADAVVGVQVDAEMRPRAEGGELLSEHLFACGALLDGIDVLGVGAGRVGAALSGWLAGAGAARRVHRRHPDDRDG